MARPIRTALLAGLVGASLLGPAITTAFAVQPDEVLADPALERRARTLSGELRCLVCQNQSLDDSDAPLARDLRLLVRERLRAGDADGAVLDFVVARYGDFILLRPPLSGATTLLWFGPLLMVGAAIAGLAVASRRRRTAPPAAALSPEDRAAVDRMLAEDR